MRTASPSPASLVGSPRPPAASAPPPSSLLARAPDVSLGRRSGRGGGGGGTCQRGSCLLQVLSLHISDHALLLQRFLHGRPHSASPTTRSERWADGLQPESGRQAGAGAKGEGARRARSHPRAPPSVSASSPAPPSASPAAPAWKRSRSLGRAKRRRRSVRAGLAHLRPPQLRLQRRLRLLHLIDEHDKLLHLARRHLPSAAYVRRRASARSGAMS